MAEPFKIIPTNARVTPLSSNTSGLQNVTPDVPFVRKSNSKLELKTNPHKKSMIQRKIKPLRGHTLLSKKKVKYDSNTTMAVFEEEMELVNVANATEMEAEQQKTHSTENAMYDSSVQKELLSLKSEPEATLIDRHSDVKQSVTRDQQYKSLEENAQKDYSEIYGLNGSKTNETMEHQSPEVSYMYNVRAQTSYAVAEDSKISSCDINCSCQDQTLVCIRTYGLNSEHVRLFHFEKVCAKAKMFFSAESDIWVGFEAGTLNIPVVVAVVKEKHLNVPEHIYDFKLLQRVRNKVSGEAAFCLEKEREETPFSKEEMKILHECITKHSPALLNHHSNIQIISGSRIKCQRFSLSDTKTDRKACIVLYVHIKGVIPVNETEFPKEIEGIPMDVREGCFKTFMYQEGAGDSPEYHRNFTMGCHIANSYQMSGSLGGFMQLPNKSIGCLTCWHIFETNKSRTDLEKDILAHKDFQRAVFQPGPALEYNFKFGEVIGGIYREGNESEIGVDAALIEITEKHREPRHLYLDGGVESFEFSEGETLNSFEQIHLLQEGHYKIVKYGAQTRLTIGRVQITGAAINNWNPKNLPQEKVRLHQQIEVYPEHSSAFADEGDSGSLVHLVSENNGEQSIRAIGMLVGGTTYGTGIVTPIWAILDNFDLPNQLLASDDQRIRKLYRGMTDVKTELTSIKTEIVNMKTELSSKIDSLLSLIHRNTPNP